MMVFHMTRPGREIVTYAMRGGHTNHQANQMRWRNYKNFNSMVQLIISVYYFIAGRIVKKSNTLNSYPNGYVVLWFIPVFGSLG